uniref:E3 ubiquitin-protein ligase FANCL n=1 Tax=Culex pipiens TaxID=7175 RepID=A0A8D8I2P1_CULPI
MSLFCDEKFKFLQKHPFVAEIEENCFVGYVAGRFKLQIILPDFPQLDNMKIAVFDALQLVNIEQVSKNGTLDEYMENLTNFLTGRTTPPAKESNPDASAILAILSQLEQLKKEHHCQVHINSSLSQLKLSRFKGDDQHFLELARAFETTFSVISHSLPDLGSSVELFMYPAAPEAHTTQFVRVLEQLEEFYSNLNTLDQLCYVVDPTEVDTRLTWRIIKFSQKVFLKITLHPLQPSSIEVAFIGPTDEIELLREQYNGKLEDWDPDSDVYTNMLRIFEIMSFPMRTEDEADAIDCGICMSHRDDRGKIPIVSCDNEKCSLVFHVDCMKQWFLSLKESKTFFAISIGTCPYCKQKLSSSFDMLLRCL